VAERVRSAIEQKSMSQGARRNGVHCTVTIGVSHGFIGEASLEQAMRQADVALYRGKSAGRNRIELHGELEH